MRSLMPRIAHLPGSSPGRDDMLLDGAAARPFFEEPVIVTEKLDDVSLTVGKDALGELGCGFRGGWDGALGGRLARAARLWLELNADRLEPLARGGRVLFGEWLWHRFSVAYDRLPDAVVFYGVRDRRGRILPRCEGLELLRAGGLPIPEVRFEGVLGRRQLAKLCGRSQFGGERAEGLVLELRDARPVRWAKWVRADYAKPAYRGLTGEKNLVRERRPA